MARVSEEDAHGTRELRVSPSSPTEGAQLLARLRRARITARFTGGLIRIPKVQISQVAGVLLPTEHQWDASLAEEAGAALAAHRRSLTAMAEVAKARADPRKALGDYSFPVAPKGHQLEAVAMMTVPGLSGFALFDEMGLGKTWSVLFAFDALRGRGELERMVVIAPMKALQSAWIDQGVTRVFPEKYSTALLQGDAVTRGETLRKDYDILLVTYGQARRDLTPLLTYLRRGAPTRRTMLVVDESDAVKNPDALQSTAVAEMRRECSRCIVLCGFPAPHSATDVVNQIEIADGSRVFLAGLDAGATWETINSMLMSRPAFLRRTKLLVAPDLPGKTFRSLMLEMAPRQSEMYRKLAEELTLEVNSITDEEFTRRYTSYFERRVRLLQLCSTPAMLDDTYAEVPCKQRVLDRLLVERIEEQSEKVVLWSYFVHSVAALMERYSRYDPLRLDGSTERAAEVVREFQKEEGPRLLIANPMAGSAGITLHAARVAIYESLTDRAGAIIQSLDRIHRIGQSRPVEYEFLICAGTVEEAQYEFLSKKLSAGKLLLGDTDQPTPTRKEFLAQVSPPAGATGDD